MAARIARTAWSPFFIPARCWARCTTFLTFATTVIACSPTSRPAERCAGNSIIRSDMPHSTVNIKIDRDGGVVVYTGASEIGQGSDTMVAQIVAEGLGCKLGRVKVIAADTDLTPIDIGSYSSRVTFMNG